jgi:hypothetical protein
MSARRPGRIPAEAALAATALVVLAASQAHADDPPPYVGMWSKRMEHCSTEQKRPGAPMIMTDKGFDQHDLHCTFRKMEPTAALAPGAATWKMEADCTYGSAQRPMQATISVLGDTLTLVDRGGSNELKKCAR